jgi:hypothetical protein
VKSALILLKSFCRNRRPTFATCKINVNQTPSGYRRLIISVYVVVNLMPQFTGHVLKHLFSFRLQALEGYRCLRFVLGSDSVPDAALWRTGRTESVLTLIAVGVPASDCDFHMYMSCLSLIRHV